jgi:hypothetical protein
MLKKATKPTAKKAAARSSKQVRPLAKKTTIKTRSKTVKKLSPSPKTVKPAPQKAASGKKTTTAPVGKKTAIRSVSVRSSGKGGLHPVSSIKPILRSDLLPDAPEDSLFLSNDQKPTLHRRPLLVYTK